MFQFDTFLSLKWKESKVSAQGCFNAQSSPALKGLPLSLQTVDGVSLHFTMLS